jgi:hypothetical protein
MTSHFFHEIKKQQQQQKNHIAMAIFTVSKACKQLQNSETDSKKVK